MNDGRKSQLDRLAVVLLLMCCSIWGLAQVAAKVALADIPPLLQVGLRSLGAALLLVAWSQWRGLPIWQRDGTAPAGWLAGAFFAVEFACMFVGLQYTTASRMAVFTYLSPFVVALGMPFIARHERLTLVQASGLLLAFGGVAWAFAEGFVDPAAGPQQWVGDALGMAAALLWGLTTLVVRGSKLSSALPEKTLLYQLAIAGAALVLAGLWHGERLPPSIAWLSWASWAYQTGVVSFASFLTWFWLVRHYPATRVAAFTLLTPVLGLLGGVLLLGEPLTLRLPLALVAVCGGIALVNTASQRPARLT